MREQEKREEGTGESESGPGGVRGILRATGRQAERQEVAWACARALWPRACVLLSEEEDDRDGCGGGLGCYSRRPGKWAAS